MIAPILDDVSRETMDLLRRFEGHVRQWNPRINLVSKSSLDEFTARHFVDGLQASSLSDTDGKWVDMGSGAGFPGIIISIMQGHRRPVVLVESDQRKCAFLRTVKRDLGLTCSIVNARIEDLEPQEADAVSARALAPLQDLFELSERHTASGGKLYFPKGRNWREEEVAARAHWSYDLQVVDNPAQVGSVILVIENLRRVAE